MGTRIHILRNLALPDDRCVLLETEERGAIVAQSVRVAHSMSLRCHSDGSAPMSIREVTPMALSIILVYTAAR